MQGVSKVDRIFSGGYSVLRPLFELGTPFQHFEECPSFFLDVLWAMGAEFLRSWVCSIDVFTIQNLDILRSVEKGYSVYMRCLHQDA